MKKIVSVLLATVLAIGCLTGCGEKAADSGNNQQASNSGELVFKIGGSGPLTGGAAAYGDAVNKGAQIAVDEINAAGGINGVKLEWKMEDDEHDAEKGVNAYNSLKDWGMQIMMGTVTSAPCIAVEAEASNDNMFLITPSGTAVDCISGSNAFRLCFSDPAQGTKSAEYIGVNKLATKVAVIYDSSDPYSAGICESFKAEASKQGIEVVASEAFTADSKTDFKVQLQKAKDSGAELLFLPIYYQEASLILSQANEMGFSPKIFGCDGLDGILGVENFDVSLAEGVMLLTPFAADAQDELTKKFVATYAEKFNGEVPMQFAADAYDAIYAIKAAIEKSGATADMSASEICDKMSAAMTEITLTGLTGTITWDASGEPNKEPKAVVIENGAYKAMQ
ncbi:MAG: ABC transporter substrate-binding protein [Lachnospiraceae bacterium]|nr:ABC transporter substrate-binding protein [Lachnospiraceae bacterium]